LFAKAIDKFFAV